MTQEADANAITKSSKSNLALAFVSLPKERRDDMTLFYAFCRIVDDIADSSALPVAEKQAQLDAWRAAIDAPGGAQPTLADDVRALIAKYKIPSEHFHEIISGVEMDLAPRRYATFDDLRLYCYRVASAVGLVSIEIFGYKNPGCKDYAIDLGLALQITNIIRDVGEDWANGGRIYLPVEDMERFGFSEEDLRVGKQNGAFDQLIRFEAERAREFYNRATAELPPEDARSMVAAEIMHRVYRTLLDKMERDGFRVLEKRYAHGKWKKTGIVARVLLANILNRR
jgi:phytoene synthase